MTDPDTSLFWVSWQWTDSETGEGGLVEEVDLVGAHAAVAWGILRASRGLIRLGHTDDTYFAFGADVERSLPRWPPKGPPADGWWTPSEK